MGSCAIAAVMAGGAHGKLDIKAKGKTGNGLKDSNVIGPGGKRAEISIRRTVGYWNWPRTWQLHSNYCPYSFLINSQRAVAWTLALLMAQFPQQTGGRKTWSSASHLFFSVLLMKRKAQVMTLKMSVYFQFVYKCCYLNILVQSGRSQQVISLSHGHLFVYCISEDSVNNLKN